MNLLIHQANSSSSRWFESVNLALHRDRRIDPRVRIVADDLEVLDLEVEDRVRHTVDLQPRERTDVTRQLKFHLLEVVLVDVRVGADPDHPTGLETAHQREHLQQE